MPRPAHCRLCRRPITSPRPIVGGNNVYDVVVQVSDGTNTDSQAIAVSVSNLNDNAPAISSNGGGANASVSIAENSTAVTT